MSENVVYGTLSTFSIGERDRGVKVTWGDYLCVRPPNEISSLRGLLGCCMRDPSARW